MGQGVVDAQGGLQTLEKNEPQPGIWKFRYISIPTYLVTDS